MKNKKTSVKQIVKKKILKKKQSSKNILRPKKSVSIYETTHKKLLGLVSKSETLADYIDRLVKNVKRK